jgi:hypothetical protein
MMRSFFSVSLRGDRGMANTIPVGWNAWIAAKEETMATCEVCHAEVSPGDAVKKSDEGGSVHYYCSEGHAAWEGAAWEEIVTHTESEALPVAAQLTVEEIVAEEEKAPPARKTRKPRAKKGE